ncbi:MAG: PAS domain-containing protein, partial [Tepidisphaeraceae bacterium]
MIRILLVEADGVDRLAVRRALESAGLSGAIVEVDSGDAALERATRGGNGGEPFDVILMDHHLPDHDGLEMLAHLHAAGVQTPVVMMTGHRSEPPGSEQLAVDLMKAGAADYLPGSSVNAELLSRSVRSAVRVHRAEQAARAAAEALRRGEEHSRFLAETIPQIVWTATPDGDLDYFSAAWTRYSGQPPTRAEVGGGLGAGWLEAVHRDDRAAVIARWQHSLKTAALYDTEFRLRRQSDGAYRWHLVRATPMREDGGGARGGAGGGAVIKWFGTCTDVHDWRRAQESLRVQRERLEMVLGASELGLWYCDLPFDVLEWNDKCREHFFLPPGTPVTFDVFRNGLHPDDRQRTVDAIKQSIDSHCNYDIVYRTLPSEPGAGATPAAGVAQNWIRAIGRPLYDASGTPVRFDGITMDVTAQKRSEETLRQAKEAAEAASNAKDRFLSVLSHELRTPLMPVLTEVAALEMEAALAQDVRASLGVIRRNVELEARLIDDLLDLTRISKGKLLLNLETVDLHELLHSAMDICAADLMGKRLTTTLDLAATKHHVKADPARLQQVCWNLIKNAVKFTPTGGHLTIHSYDEPPAATGRNGEEGQGGVTRVS